MEAILTGPGWKVRILTKNAAVQRDFDVIKQHSDRVLVGLSLTGTMDKASVIKAVEPNASTIPERMAVLEKAHFLGLRTFGMFCPLLPGIADDTAWIQELAAFGLRSGGRRSLCRAGQWARPGFEIDRGSPA